MKNKITILSFMLFFAPFAFADNTEQIKRGAYLADLSDCYACHTVANGEQYGGGLAFSTPFGIVYSTNISSDKKAGIGNYSYQEFYDAMHNGLSPKGNLYPAMPYTSYHLILKEDMSALYSYFMNTPPSTQKNKDNDMAFPFNIRFGLKFWNFFFANENEYVFNKEKSETWNRGNYILNSFGHCGECHTPRNFLFAMNEDKHFQGAMIDGAWASDITPEHLISLGYGTEDLKNLLSAGYSKKGTVKGEMYTVVYHSLSKFNDQDLNAAVTYLLDSDTPVLGSPPTYNPPDKTSKGHQLYMNYCSGCHGYEGQGINGFSPALTGMGSLQKNNVRSVVQSVLYGIDTQYYSPTHAFYKMPGFAKKLNNQDLTLLINYLGKTFTSDHQKFKQNEISTLRAQLAKEG